MPSTVTTDWLVKQDVQPLTGARKDYDALLDGIGEAHFALLGEASHGTHEFYSERAEITKRLIQEKGFTAVAVEADWPDAYRLNLFVRGVGGFETAEEALEGFRRFSTWMWRNTDVLAFVEWLRRYNDGLPPGVPKTGFYGLDLYSLYASIEAVLGYLAKTDPEAFRRAKERYSCFDHFNRNVQAYGFAAGLGLTESCEKGAIEQLVELQRRAAEYASRDGRLAADEYFYAEQNARLIKNAEQYYRAMFGDSVSSWNLRDRHMAETLDALVAHLRRQGEEPKVAVWEHNSHVGDARATELGERGEVNVGSLVRERYSRDAFLVGFTTYTGTVTAASDWDGPAERKRVQPALSGSYEEGFHGIGLAKFLVGFARSPRAAERLQEPRLERAIGVVYRPETERQSHCFCARMPQQFDAVLHFDETRAVEPLEITAEWRTGEPAETFPFGV